ncbi:MAG: valyl-tRNA synthetase, partial [Parcubacteria group bacterium LiPW_72]
VLDTWFSSGLWPFSTLGWPQETADLKKYYPSDVMVTAPGIIYLWICRMIILGLKFMDDVPFRTAFIHGTLRDEKGQKMSKSLGNGVDPLEMIEKYSADALRFALAGSAYPGRDIKMSRQAMEDKIRASRNFVTKIYNATKLIIENTRPIKNYKGAATLKIAHSADNMADRWISYRLHYTIKKVTQYLQNYKIAYAAKRLYKFFWNELCDWYLEIAKARIYSENKEEQKEVGFILRQILRETLKLLHPFMPFITEELYHELKEKDDLIITPWPSFPAECLDRKARNEFKLIQEKVTQIRTQKKSKIKLSKAGEKIVGYLTRNLP